MNSEFRVNPDVLSGAGLSVLTNCALAVALVDGSLDDAEKEAIRNTMIGIIGDADTVDNVLGEAMMKVTGADPNALFQEACAMLDGEGKEACFVIAAAVATSAGSIGTKEGIALQSLAKITGIGYPGAKYNELLGKGMKLARA